MQVMESTPLPPPAPRLPLLWTYASWSLLAGALLVYSQTLAFTGDEGFHALAAQLVQNGKRPYLDFCFPQTPLNAYWNAFCMRVFGDGWRTVHAMAALFTSAATILMAQFVLRRFPERGWRAAGAIAAAALVGLNSTVVEFGPLTQAYGLCLFAIVCAYRLTVLAVERRGAALSAMAGLMAGIGAGSTLLSAPVAPVLLIWLLWNMRAGRWWKGFAFAIGAAVPFLPMLRLFLQAPWVVWFNIAQYHLHYRVVYWPDPLPHDFQILTGWTEDPQALLLGLLAISGLVFIARRSNWEPALRSQFYLCAWLVLGISAELAFGHPTFSRYFCLTVPFLGLLAIAGLYAIGSRVFAPDRAFWPVAIMVFISAAAAGRYVYDRTSDVYTWSEHEDIARKLQEVTPPNREVFTDEIIYFLTRRQPLPGMEFGYSHKLKLPPGELAALHVMPEAELKGLVAAGRFYSAATCDDDTIKDYGLEAEYKHKALVHDCPVFWEPKTGGK